MNPGRLTCLLITTISSVVTIRVAIADTLTVTREGSGMGGESVATVEFWSGDDRIARIDGTNRMIVDLSAEMLYMVNDEAKTCHAIPTRDPDRDPAALQAAVDAVEFRNTGRSEQIGDWQASLHELNAGGGDDALDIEVWISEEIEVDSGQRAYAESVATPDTAWMLAMYDLGFPVRAEIQMGPVKMWSELESVEEKPAPTGTYAIPEGCD